MRFPKGFIKKAVNGDAAAAATIDPIVRNCAAIACSKQSAPSIADDVAQEVWMFLFYNHARIDPNYNLEPFLLKVASFICMSHNRRFGMYGTGDMPGSPSGELIERENGHDLLSLPWGNASAAELPSDESMDAGSAVRKLLSESAELRVEVRLERERELSGLPDASSARAKQRRFSVTDEQRSLRGMRMAMKVTQRKMSALLGIRLCTYQSYEYGRTLSVPEIIMSQAAALAAGLADNRHAPAAQAGHPAPALQAGHSKPAMTPAARKPSAKSGATASPLVERRRQAMPAGANGHGGVRGKAATRRTAATSRMMARQPKKPKKPGPLSRPTRISMRGLPWA